MATDKTKLKSEKNNGVALSLVGFEIPAGSVERARVAPMKNGGPTLRGIVFSLGCS